jgi:hypothetical protein
MALSPAVYANLSGEKIATHSQPLRLTLGIGVSKSALILSLAAFLSENNPSRLLPPSLSPIVAFSALKKSLEKRPSACYITT